MMDFYRFADKKLSCMKERLSTGGGVAIYPFGMEAKAVKSLLEVHYGITPVLLLDNFLCREYPEKIHSLDALREPEYRDVTVLIVSDLATIHDKLLNQLYAVYPKEKCIDLLYDVNEGLLGEAGANSLKWVELALEKAQSSGMMENGMVYHPKKTHANMFLPLALTDIIQRDLLMSDDYFDRKHLADVFSFDDHRIARAVKGHTVLDIGANIGNHSLYFALEKGARKVIAFEPVPLTFSILKRNVEINHLEDRIELHNCGLGEENVCATVPSYDTKNIGGTSLRPGTDGGIVIRVLDEMELPDDIALVKIDVEGMEPDVVQGAMKMLRAQHPYVMMESFERNAPTMIRIMKELGYEYQKMGGADYLFY